MAGVQAENLLLLDSNQNNFVPDPYEKPRLMRYLPGIYADDPFLVGFLGIFESIWAPLDRQIDQLYAYFHPRLTPTEFLPWLGSWVGLALDENWPIGKRRVLIQQAVDLYLRRGTPGGLQDYLKIYTDVVPEILEDGISGDGNQPFHFTVRFRVPDPDAIDQERVRLIIDEEKPAHTIYTLLVEKS